MVIIIIVYNVYNWWTLNEKIYVIYTIGIVHEKNGGAMCCSNFVNRFKRNLTSW